MRAVRLVCPEVQLEIRDGLVVGDEVQCGREVVALGGHTHSLENLRKGDSMEGWKKLFGVDGLPFTHITAGAISGDWYSGRLLLAGYPTAVQRDGAQPGVLTLDFKNAKVTERFTVRGEDDDRQMSLGLNTPAYRDWYAQNIQKKGSAATQWRPPGPSRCRVRGSWSARSTPTQPPCRSNWSTAAVWPTAACTCGAWSSRRTCPWECTPPR